MKFLTLILGTLTIMFMPYCALAAQYTNKHTCAGVVIQYVGDSDSPVPPVIICNVNKCGKRIHTNILKLPDYMIYSTNIVDPIMLDSIIDNVKKYVKYGAKIQNDRPIKIYIIENNVKKSFYLTAKNYLMMSHSIIILSGKKSKLSSNIIKLTNKGLWNLYVH